MNIYYMYIYIYIHICSWNSMWIQHNRPRPLPKCTAGRWCAAFQLRVVSFASFFTDINGASAKQFGVDVASTNTGSSYRTTLRRSQ